MADNTQTITLNQIPGTRGGAVAYCCRTGKLSVCDGPFPLFNIQQAIRGLTE